MKKGEAKLVNSNELYILVRINKSYFKCLADTGCTCSIVGSSFFEEFPGMLEQVQPLSSSTFGQNISGQTVQYIGKLRLTFEIGEEKYSHVFLYAKDVVYGLVLGLDFLRQNGASINLRKHKVKFQKNAMLKTQSNVTVPPMSEVLIPTEMSSNLQTINVVSVKGSAYAVNQGLLVANSVVTMYPSAKSYYVRMINVHGEPITLREGKSVAHVEVLNGEDCVIDKSNGDNFAKANALHNGLDPKCKDDAQAIMIMNCFTITSLGNTLI